MSRHPRPTAYLRVTDNSASLLGFHGGSDAGLVSVGATVRPSKQSNNVPGCTVDNGAVFMTRYTGLKLLSASKQFFDIRTPIASVMEQYVGAVVPSFSQIPYTQLRDHVAVSDITAVDGIGNLLLPGGSFDVLRERTSTVVEMRVDALVSSLGWIDIAVLGGALPGVRLGAWEQTSYRYFDAVSKESLAITYPAIAPFGQGNPLAIDQVQFNNLAPVPEPQWLALWLAGLWLRLRLVPPRRTI